MPGTRLTKLEIGTRPFRGVDLELIEREQTALRERIAHADVDFVVRVVGSVFADLQSVRDELHRHTDLRHVGAEHRRLGAIDVELPLDAGHRARVVDVAKPVHLRVHVLAHARRRRAPAVSRSRDRNSSSIGLPTRGPCSIACTSTVTPANDAVRVRISSRIAELGVSRSFSPTSSTNIWPMRSSPRRVSPNSVVQVFRLLMTAHVEDARFDFVDELD